MFAIFNRANRVSPASGRPGNASPRRQLALALAAVAAVGAVSHVSAAPLYWDTDDANGLQGGAGNWSTTVTDTFWNTDAAGGAGTFTVHLIPETLRVTTFGGKQAGDRVNLEIERRTQVIVDTVREMARDLVRDVVLETVREATPDAVRDSLAAVRR